MKNYKIFLFLLIILFFFFLGYLIANVENSSKIIKDTELRQIALVNNTVDGDTIDTNLGRTRLLGINNKIL